MMQHGLHLLSGHLTSSRTVSRRLLGITLAAGILCAVPAAASARTVWLCKPGLADNPCVGDLTATITGPDGSTRTEPTRPARRPGIDCFYVYPTVSAQQTVNANRNIDPELRAVAGVQASRFSAACRVFAPVYRQVTRRGLVSGGFTPANLGIGYADVRAAWRDYVRNHNRSRGVVLIGHSQGTGMLVRLARELIDRRPAVRRRLVSAILLGGWVAVRKGRDAGGDFKNISACRAARQTGCVVAYSAYSDVPPNSIFGRVADTYVRHRHPSRLEVLCTNPASLAGGRGLLRPYFPAWVSYPRLYSAVCRRTGGQVWLEVDDIGGPTDMRPRVSQSLGPTWGLHQVDVNIALGNLVEVVRRQAAAWRRR
jgi:hypothetical protein